MQVRPSCACVVLAAQSSSVNSTSSWTWNSRLEMEHVCLSELAQVNEPFKETSQWEPGMSGEGGAEHLVFPLGKKTAFTNLGSSWGKRASRTGSCRIGGSRWRLVHDKETAHDRTQSFPWN